MGVEVDYCLVDGILADEAQICGAQDEKQVLRLRLARSRQTSLRMTMLWWVAGMRVYWR